MIKYHIDIFGKLLCSESLGGWTDSSDGRVSYPPPFSVGVAIVIKMLPARPNAQTIGRHGRDYWHAEAYEAISGPANHEMAAALCCPYVAELLLLFQVNEVRRLLLVRFCRDNWPPRSVRWIASSIFERTNYPTRSVMKQPNPSIDR